MDNKENLSKLKASIYSNIAKTLCMIGALIALSVGLAFYLLVQNNAGMVIGIIMFVVAGLMFITGMVQYMMRIRNIKNIRE